MSKKCGTCKIEMDISLFPKRNKSKDGYDLRCKKCHSKCALKFKDKRLPNRLKYERENRDRILLKKKEYVKLNSKKKAVYDIEYRKRKAAQIAQYKKDWEFKMRNEPIFKIKRNMRRRLNHALKGNLKADKTFNLVGCTPQFLITYLEAQFKEGMNWKNYGQWHVDHIKPCSSFNLLLPEEQKACFHYTNLQPLWGRDNLAKAKKIL